MNKRVKLDLGVPELGIGDANVAGHNLNNEHN